MLAPSPRTAARVAYVAAALNLAAGLAMLVLLKPGLPVPGSLLPDRLGYIRGHPGLWRGGWILWHAAAISLVLLLFVLAERFRRHAPVRATIAEIVSVVGLAADLAAEAIAMGVTPVLGLEHFLLLESIAGVLTGYLANGLYTVAGVLLTWAGARELPRAVVALGIAVWSAGLCLSAASLAHSAAGQLWSTAVLMPLFVLWAALVGLWLKRSGS
jgi:hypothetical protein